MSVPPHSFVEPWNPLSCRCKVKVGASVYDVVYWTAPVRVVRYTARRDGRVVAERGRFPALLRDLAKLDPAPLPQPREVRQGDDDGRPA